MTMGATNFSTVATGSTAEQAFQTARRDAQYEHGHGGYTGTVAEKDEFTIIPMAEPVTKQSALAYARRLVEEGDPRIDDKWGPAGCIQIAPNEYLFFGIASC